MPVGMIKAFFGLDPAPAVKGMEKAKKTIRSGSQDINRTLRSMKRLAGTAFAGWGVAALGKDFVKAAMDMDSMRRSMAAAVGTFEKGTREINYLRKESFKLGVSFKDSAKDFKMLSAAAKGTALEGEGIRKVWRSLQNATVALQLTTAETSGTVYAFKDMLSKGTVQAEELKRQLGNRLPGAFRLAAKAMGMTTVELAKQMKMGKLMSDEFLPALAKALDETYAEAAVEASKTMRGELTRMKSAWFDFQSLFMETSGLSDALTKIFKNMAIALNDINDAIGRGTFWAEIFLEVGTQAQIAEAKIKNLFKVIGMERDIKSQFPDDVKKKYQAIDSKFDVKEFDVKAKNFMQKASNLGDKMAAEFEKDNWSFWWKAAKTLTVQGAYDLFKKRDEILEKDSKDFKKKILSVSEEKNKALKEAGVWDYAKALKDAQEKNKKTLADEIKSLEALRDKKKKILQNKPSTRDLMPEKEVGSGIPEVELSKWTKISLDLEESFRKLGEKSTDIAKNIQSVFTSAFKGIEDALVQMVQKGKVDWRSLADSMIADMVRITARQAITGPLAMALSGAFGNMATSLNSSNNMTGLTGSVANYTTPNSTGLAPIKMASGGMINEHIVGVGQSSGRKYEMGENGSEAVLNQDQIRALSARKGSSVNVQPIINISTPPGTQATTQQSSDGMNMDILITAIESKLSSNMRRGSGLSDTMAQTFGLNRAAGAFR